MTKRDEYDNDRFVDPDKSLLLDLESEPQWPKQKTLMMF